MAKLFGKKENFNVSGPHRSLETAYKNSISNMLLIVAFTVVNIVLLIVNADTYFLFSAFIPYLLADYAMYFGGKYPPEYYELMGETEVYADNTFFAVALTLAFVTAAVYLICWLAARKKKLGGIIAALVFFIIDTVVMFLFLGFDMSIIVDVIMHGFVIVCLVNAIINFKKIKAMPAEAEMLVAEEDESINTELPLADSPVLRMADTEVKSRTLLEADHMGQNIVYRRVKTVNELVINGRVYDEYEALVEHPHSLVARVNGHDYEACIEGIGIMKIIADGEVLVKKLRVV